MNLASYVTTYLSELKVTEQSTHVSNGSDTIIILIATL